LKLGCLGGRPGRRIWLFGGLDGGRGTNTSEIASWETGKMTSNKNFSGQSTPSIIDDTYYRCNFTQPQPVFYRDGSAHGVRLFPGDDTPRSFLECNLTNCEIPPGSTVEECNTAVVSRHQAIATEEVIVDGRAVTRTTKEGNIMHGHYDENGNLIRPELRP
jgi:hypothetical protein